VTRATTAVGLAVALAAIGCGSDTIDAAEVEAGIEQSLSSATASVSSVSCPNDDAVEPALEEELAASGVPDTTVDCPDTIKVKEGETVTCTATGSGGRQSQLTFTFSSADGTIDESSVNGAGS
jgi:hypothetical protein